MRHLRKYVYRPSPDIARYVQERAELLALWDGCVNKPLMELTKKVRRVPAGESFHVSDEDKNMFVYSPAEHMIGLVNSFIARWCLPVEQFDAKYIDGIHGDVDTMSEWREVCGRIEAVRKRLFDTIFERSMDFRNTIYSSENMFLIRKGNLHIELSNDKELRYKIYYGKAVTYENDSLRYGTYMFTANHLCEAQYAFIGCHFVFVLEGHFAFTYHLCTNTLSCYRKRSEHDVAPCRRANAVYLFALRRKIAQKAARFKTQNIHMLLTSGDRTIVDNFL